MVFGRGLYCDSFPRKKTSTRISPIKIRFSEVLKILDQEIFLYKGILLGGRGKTILVLCLNYCILAFDD